MGDVGVSGCVEALPSDVRPLEVPFERAASSALRSARIEFHSRSACSLGVRVFGGALCFCGSADVVDGESLDVSLGLEPQSQPILRCTIDQA